MNDVQKRVDELILSAEPQENLKKWLRGRIPKNYKRLTIDMDEAIELATFGASRYFAYFQEKLHFTQALLVGAALSGKYNKITITTTSQYGKSFTLGGLGIILASMSTNDVKIAGGTDDLANTIMKQAINKLQYVHEDVKNKLLGSFNKIEKLKTSTSKSKVAFMDAGSMEIISFGISSSNALSNNKALGKGDIYIVDECDVIPDEVLAEAGRREYSNIDGTKALFIQASNPHFGYSFYKDLIGPVQDDELVIWMDVRTSVEEGRIPSLDFVKTTDFYKEKSQCKRYLLCELEDFSEESMFGEPVIDDGDDISEYDLFLGIDSAYKGVDSIDAALSGQHRKTGIYKVFDIMKIEKANWVDGETSKRIIGVLKTNINRFRMKNVCIDIGYGVWLIEGLSNEELTASVTGINFGENTTNYRREVNQYAAIYGANKRAEMHLDLQQLIDSKSIVMTSQVYEKIKEQMNATKTYIVGDGKKRRIIKKEEIKRLIGKSPDELDSVILSIHAGILYNLSRPLLLYQEKGEQA